MSPNKVHSLTVDGSSDVYCFSATFGLSASMYLPAFPELMNLFACLFTDTVISKAIIYENGPLVTIITI